MSFRIILTKVFMQQSVPGRIRWRTHDCLIAHIRQYLPVLTHWLQILLSTGIQRGLRRTDGRTALQRDRHRL